MPGGRIQCVCHEKLRKYLSAYQIYQINSLTLKRRIKGIIEFRLMLLFLFFYFQILPINTYF